MGKLMLGLEDRSARLIHGRDVWLEIKNLLSGYNDIQAAIAFVGPDADHYLPLRGPATIVVNAGDDALRTGATDPQVLLRWTRRGVRVHSLPTLHAKVILAQGNPSFVMVGSADVLSVSGRALDEALLVADERQTVDEIRDAIADWRRMAGEPLAEAWLQAATGRYRVAAPHRLPVAGLADERPAPHRPAPSPLAAAGPVTVTAPHQPPPRAAEPQTATQPPGHLNGQRSATQQSAPTVAGPSEVAAPAEGHAPAEAAPQAEAAAPAGVAAPAGGDEPTGAATGTSEQGDGGAPDGQEAPAAEPVHWPRPKYIYLAPLTRDGRASASALEHLERLREEFCAPPGAVQPVLEVRLFWWDEAPRSAGRSTTTYREGWHVVPISVAPSARPAVLSQVDSPSRVLHSYTEYAGGPPRTYYYLLTHSAGPSTTFRRLREALTAVGEKPSYDHAYMMAHKVAAILDLWPQIGYSD